MFRESDTATLATEIANLKTIIGRFSDFSKMPKPELERVEASEVVWRVALLHFFPTLSRKGGRSVEKSTNEGKNPVFC